MTRREAQKIVDKWFKQPGTCNIIDLVFMTEHYLINKTDKTKSESPKIYYEKYLNTRKQK